MRCCLLFCLLFSLFCLGLATQIDDEEIEEACIRRHNLNPADLAMVTRTSLRSIPLRLKRVIRCLMPFMADDGKINVEQALRSTSFSWRRAKLEHCIEDHKQFVINNEVDLCNYAGNIVACMEN